MSVLPTRFYVCLCVCVCVFHMSGTNRLCEGPANALELDFLLTCGH